MELKTFPFYWRLTRVCSVWCLVWAPPCGIAGLIYRPLLLSYISVIVWVVSHFIKSELCFVDRHCFSWVFNPNCGVWGKQAFRQLTWKIHGLWLKRHALESCDGDCCCMGQGRLWFLVTGVWLPGCRSNMILSLYTPYDPGSCSILPQSLTLNIYKVHEKGVA